LLSFSLSGCSLRVTPPLPTPPDIYSGVFVVPLSLPFSRPPSFRRRKPLDCTPPRSHSDLYLSVRPPTASFRFIVSPPFVFSAFVPARNQTFVCLPPATVRSYPFLKSPVLVYQWSGFLTFRRPPRCCFTLIILPDLRPYEELFSGVHFFFSGPPQLPLRRATPPLRRLHLISQVGPLFFLFFKFPPPVNSDLPHVE